jgi:hypothetical protein
MIEQPATPARASDGSAAACAARAGCNTAGAGERLTDMRVFGGDADAAAREARP